MIYCVHILMISTTEKSMKGKKKKKDKVEGNKDI